MILWVKVPNPSVPLGGHLTGSAALAKAVFSTAMLAAICIISPPKLARAQALQANGTTVIAPPGDYGPITGPVNAQGGTAFDAINGGVIETSGVVQLLASEPGSRGVWAHQGSVTLFPGSTVSTSGDGEAYGLQASGAGSQVTATNVTVTTTGQLDSATGFSPNGVLANSGGEVTLNGGGVTTQGESAIGAFSSSASTMSLMNVIITTTGDDAAGLLAAFGGSSITVNGGSVSTSGAFAYGAWAFGNGTITLENTSVTTTGPDAVALVADAGGPTGQPTVINVTDSAVISQASGGAQVNDGAALILSRSQLTGQTYGVSITDTENTGLTNLLALDGAKLASVTGDAISVDGAVATITAMNGTTISSGSGNLVSATNLSDVALTVDDSSLTGNLIADAASVANGQLLNSSQLTGAIQSWHDLSVDATSSWTITANSNLTGTVTNAGLVEFTAPDPFKTLTTRNYVGVGGTLGLNTYLGSDGSPSDKLIINGGTATGNSLLRIVNAGGPGAKTRADGILVVQAINGATTAPGAFTLSNGELRAGAFDYDLFRGGLGVSNRQDWFLRSDFAGGGGTGGGGGGGLLPIPPFPIEPPPDPLPPNVLFPIIGPELATYGVVQPLARQLGLSILGTLDDRRGDTYEPDGCAVQPAVAPDSLPTRKGPAPGPCPLFSPSVWGRFFGQTIHDNYQAFASPSASGDLGGFQGGIDLLRGPVIPGGYDRAGLYGAYGDVHADVDGLVTNPAATAYVLTHTGSMNLNSWSAGGYWTHVGPGGWYLDAVLQGTWYYGSASTEFAKLNTDGTGFIGSLEGGYPFAWPQLGPGFVIEPQGQILWQKVSFRHDYDGLGDVALGDTTGPSGRIGLRTKWTIATAGGQVWQPYLRANLWRDWGAEANTVYSGTDVVPLLSQTTMLELGGGLTGRINANVSVFANVDYEFAVGASESEKRNGVRGAFGAKYTW